jgi:hypothetical protein
MAAGDTLQITHNIEISLWSIIQGFFGAVLEVEENIEDVEVTKNR